MQDFRKFFPALFGMACLTTNLALANVKVEQAPLGPDGDVVGFSISPHGQHAAVMVAKGSPKLGDAEDIRWTRRDATDPRKPLKAGQGSYRVMDMTVDMADPSALVRLSVDRPVHLTKRGSPVGRSTCV